MGLLHDIPVAAPLLLAVSLASVLKSRLCLLSVFALACPLVCFK
jgi:hypothetical protein